MSVIIVPLWHHWPFPTAVLHPLWSHIETEHYTGQVCIGTGDARRRGVKGAVHTYGVVITNGHGIQASFGNTEYVHLNRGILAYLVDRNTIIELCCSDSMGESVPES